jgi:amino acid adenylation domain-containing protein/thioester reductase-like protein
MSNDVEQLTVVSYLSQEDRHYRDRIAVQAFGVGHTYGELDAQSSSLAGYLVGQLGVRPGERVGLCLEPSFRMVVGILGILKAGAAYVPIDATLPRSRIVYVLQDSRMRIVLTEKKFDIELSLSCVQAGASQVVVLGDEAGWRPFSSYPDVQLEAPQKSSLAYVIYTSGSTGEPKGVMIEHGPLLNLGLANLEIFDIGAATRILQFASLSFDAATWEIFTALIGGATLVLGMREELMPGRTLAKFIVQNRISMICMPPSLLALMDAEKDTLDCLNTVVVAGEACPVTTARSWSAGGRRMFNAYGPTEATVCATTYRVRGTEDAIPIGDPLPGVSIEIVDESMQRVPAGIVGELCIGGISVGRGYLNKQELTERAFVPNPWGEGRLYRSGDLAVSDPSTGCISFVGRKDNRVKVRGFRVELEAIEQALCEHPDVLAAAVTTTEMAKDNGASITVLVGFYVARMGPAGEPPTPSSLRVYLSTRLPGYMIPHMYVRMDALPMMANRSKVNRAALPLPRALAAVNDSPGEVLTSVRQIARIYGEVLKLEHTSFGPDMDFFQHGGTSIDVAEALVLVEQEFGVRIPSRKFYEHPTPAALTELIECWQDPRKPGDEIAAILQAEAQLPHDIPHHSKVRPRRRPRTALITGATGFLGIYLLQQLTQLAPELHIYCLVRADSARHAADRLRQTCLTYGVVPEVVERVDAVVGDIEDCRLGQSDDFYQALASNVDTVYHCAADISYVKPYSVMHGPNVIGTQNMIRFAFANRRKSFHYISTAAVFGATGTLLDVDFVDEEFDIDRSLGLMAVENGYTRSKWVAEKIVQLAGRRGLQVSTYRPGFIQGDSRTGVANVSDLLCRMMCGCIQLGLYPDFPEKYWLPIPVDVTAAAIAYISINGEPGTYHLALDRTAEASHNELFRIADSFGFAVQPVAAELWFHRLASIESSNSLFPIASFLLEKVYQGRNTILEVHHRTSVCDNAATRRALAGSGIELPQFGVAEIKRNLDYFVSRGLIRGSRQQAWSAQSRNLTDTKTSTIS